MSEKTVFRMVMKNSNYRSRYIISHSSFVPSTLRRRKLKTDAVFTLETHQMFSVHTTPEKYVFLPYQNAKSEFSNSSALQSVYEKLRFRAGLVWTVGITVEYSFVFNSPGSVDRILTLLSQL